MDKLSLYDILGMLLPGVMFLFFISVINTNYDLSTSTFLNINTIDDFKELSVLFCFSMIAGSSFYTLNFYLVTKTNWYNKVFGMYEHVASLYLKATTLHGIMNKTLNKKAKIRFGKKIFYNTVQIGALQEDEQEASDKCQGEFYDIMYYELEHHDKIGYAKDFQSFYFFFRQMVTALMFTIMLTIIGLLYTIFMTDCNLSDYGLVTAKMVFGFLLLMLLCTHLARWYRKRMVMKMYWAYFTLLNNQEK